MPHPSTGIGYIFPAAGNTMDMTVMDGLPGCCADVDADIKTCDARILRPDALAQLQQQPVTVRQLLGGELEITAHVATGDDQGVQRGDRKTIPDSHGRLVLADDALVRQMTEGADSLAGIIALFTLYNFRILELVQQFRSFDDRRWIQPFGCTDQEPFTARIEKLSGRLSGWRG